jgi:hypothetical protein
LNSGPCTCLADAPFLFGYVCVGYFQDRVLQTICLVWLQSAILLVSAYWVAGITDMRQWWPFLVNVVWWLTIALICISIMTNAFSLGLTIHMVIQRNAYSNPLPILKNCLYSRVGRVVYTFFNAKKFCFFQSPTYLHFYLFPCYLCFVSYLKKSLLA